MIFDHNIIDTILFSDPLSEIERKLRIAKKESFDPNDRIIIKQDIEDTYVYIDAAGTKLIEIQKIINLVDISNCFILLVTANTEVKEEIDFITEFYSVDPVPINFSIVDGRYQKKITKYSNTACKKLWNHLYIGTDGNINPCCIADHRFPLGSIKEHSIDSIINSKKSNQIRQWMKQGYRSIACGTCYQKEDAGIASPREICDSFVESINITYLDIRINNICNFKCRMCSEYFSSSIQQETVELYGKNAKLGHEQTLLTSFSLDEKTILFDKITSYLTNSLRKIYFAGGEPLITKEHYQILDKLIEINNTDLKIFYNTNLSQLKYKSLDVIDYWNQFGNVKVGASIDASESVAEYVRHGTVWSDIVKNILNIKEHAPMVQLIITSTVSFLTIENLIKLQHQWINDGLFSSNDFSLTVLLTPNYLSPAALPQHHKQRLGSSIQNHINWLGETTLASQWMDVLKFMNNNDFTHTLNDFKFRTSVLDKHRGESFLSVFPEFKDLYAI